VGAILNAIGHRRGELVSFECHNRLIFYGADKIFRESGRQLQQFKVHPDEVHAAAIQPHPTPTFK
jgi:hypothetical protein